MHINQLTTLTQETLVFSYLPASLKKNKSGWIIEYYCEDPSDNLLHRKRLRVDHIRKRYKRQQEATAHIYKIINDINMKLMKGWNPFIHQEQARLYEPIANVVKKFLAEKTREVRPDSIRSYKSFLNTFLTFLQEKCVVKYSSQFSKNNAIGFMEYIYNDRNVSQRSYNNYLKFMRVFFNWMLEKEYVTYNPFILIKSKKKNDKKRTLIDAATRSVIINYLEKNDAKFLLVCKLIYYCLIRPKEIINLKVSDVDFERKVICIREENAKNHHQRFAAMTQDVIDSLQYVKDYAGDMWLISQNMMPSYRQAHRAKFGKMWIKLRQKLKLSQEMQLYSFRDTGIWEMMKVGGIDPLSVKQHADHHSLEMTTIYSNHADPNLTEIIYNQAPKF